MIPSFVFSGCFRVYPILFHLILFRPLRLCDPASRAGRGEALRWKWSMTAGLWLKNPRTVLGEGGEGEGERRRKGKEYYAIKVEILSEDRPRRECQCEKRIVLKSKKRMEHPLEMRVFWW